MRSVRETLGQYLGGLSRRDLFRRGSLVAAAPAFLGKSAAAAPAPAAAAGKLQLGPGDIYQSIGVRPIINCRGTLTVISGSLELAEVRAACEAAAQHHVVLDELMAGVAQRLSDITGAEWALVSSGCAAGIAHTTAACVTGGDPDLHVRIPDLSGFAKDEVVIPRFCRNEYDQAIRSVGVRIIEVSDPAEYEAALGPKVAMVYIMTGPRVENGPLNYDVIYGVAKKKNIPVFTDAAAEMPSFRPNLYLQKGSTFVGYSGGKCMRGPQCAGLILGRKDILQAAWVSSAPHHGHGRTMKVGKEEMIGMLAAVEMWAQRDHVKEDEMWTGWMQQIADRVTKISGVTAAIRQPRSIDNHSPGLSINWDPAHLGISGEQVAEMLMSTEPRVALGGAGGGGGRGRGGNANQTGISITAYMMKPEDVKTVADRVYEILSAQRPPWKPETPQTPAGDLTGQWNLEIQFAAGKGAHSLFLKQDGNRLVGAHQGEFVARDVSGSISSDEVRFTSSVGEAHGAALTYRFTGKLSGDTMSGALDMGEYLSARWTAQRHTFGRG